MLRRGMVQLKCLNVCCNLLKKKGGGREGKGKKKKKKKTVKKAVTLPGFELHTKDENNVGRHENLSP